MKNETMDKLVPRERYLLIGRHRDTGALEGHADISSGEIMMTVYRNDYPEMEWIALYDARDRHIIDGPAFDRLTHDFIEDMDRELRDQMRHDRGCAVPDGYQ